SGKSEAELMRDFLLRLGVAQSDMIVEDCSLSTYENAVQSAKILREREVERIALVTDAAHIYRASRCFDRQGLDVVPAACNFRAVKLKWSPLLFIPNAGSARNLRIAIHEWQGIIWYKLHGRI
ncbi:MAG: YdcF family protein, partial [Planctomycetota bacterium]|nr:YdcF family protein [Planctomycetota bacterium]